MTLETQTITMRPGEVLRSEKGTVTVFITEAVVTQVRDKDIAANAPVTVTRKVLVDSAGDTWWEMGPDTYAMGRTLAEAERAQAHEGAYSNHTKEDIEYSFGLREEREESI